MMFCLGTRKLRRWKYMTFKKSLSQAQELINGEHICPYSSKYLMLSDRKNLGKQRLTSRRWWIKGLLFSTDREMKTNRQVQQLLSFLGFSWIFCSIISHLSLLIIRVNTTVYSTIKLVTLIWKNSKYSPSTASILLFNEVTKISAQFKSGPLSDILFFNFFA